MRFNVYDFTCKVIKGTSVPPSEQTAGATNGSKVDTLGSDNAAVYAYGGQTSSNPSVATLAVKVQESADGSTNWSDALDNTGSVIGFTLDCQAAAAENMARIEGLGPKPEAEPTGGHHGSLNWRHNSGNSRFCPDHSWQQQSIGGEHDDFENLIVISSLRSRGLPVRWGHVARTWQISKKFIHTRSRHSAE